MTPKKHDLLLQIICNLFVFLFVYTALSKFNHFNRFITVLGKSPLIGDSNYVLAWTIPIAEIIAAILLLVPTARRLGLYTCFILMSVFTVYVAYMLVFVPHLPCSCGGVIQQMSWSQHLVFNIFFSGLAFVGIRLDKMYPQSSKRKETSSYSPEWS